MSDTLVIRKVGHSLRFSIPIEYVREHDLQEGDVVLWKPEDGHVRLRFAKVADREASKIGPVPQSAA
jgi:hypothetical protein